jgi:hypothetical protein
MIGSEDMLPKIDMAITAPNKVPAARSTQETIIWWASSFITIKI